MGKMVTVPLQERQTGMIQRLCRQRTERKWIELHPDDPMPWIPAGQVRGKRAGAAAYLDDPAGRQNEPVQQGVVDGAHAQAPPMGAFNAVENWQESMDRCDGCRCRSQKTWHLQRATLTKAIISNFVICG